HGPEWYPWSFPATARKPLAHRLVRAGSSCRRSRTSWRRIYAGGAAEAPPSADHPPSLRALKCAGSARARFPRSGPPSGACESAAFARQLSGGVGLDVRLGSRLRSRHFLDVSAAVRDVPRHVDGAALADHGHLHLTRILELVLDLPCDLVREQDGAVVVDLPGTDDDANLAPRLEGVELVD